MKTRSLVWLILICGALILISKATPAYPSHQRNQTASKTAQENQQAAKRKLAPWVIEHTSGGEEAEVLVILADRADLRPARALQTRREKGQFVRDALLSKAQQSQAPLLEWLRARGVQHRSFYIVNAIWVPMFNDRQAD